MPAFQGKFFSPWSIIVNYICFAIEGVIDVVKFTKFVKF